MLCTVTVGLASTRRTISTAVRSSIKPFQMSAAPSPPLVWVDAATAAAAEPSSATRPISLTTRRLACPVRSASSSTPKNSRVCSSATSVLNPDAESR